MVPSTIDVWGCYGQFRSSSFSSTHVTQSKQLYIDITLVVNLENK